MKLLRSAFYCALCAVENAHSSYEDKANSASCDEAIMKLRSLLKDWIADKKVIGGSVIGYTVHSDSADWKGREELKVKL